jgi:CubicO group peptidase (beta-lactamase class C family)
MAASPRRSADQRIAIPRQTGGGYDQLCAVGASLSGVPPFGRLLMSAPMRAFGRGTSKAQSFRRNAAVSSSRPHSHQNKHLEATIMTNPVVGVPTRRPAGGVASDFPLAQPEDVGIDPRPLARLSEWISEQALDIRSFLIVQDDKLVFERYGEGLDRDSNHETFSITNTVTSLLFGILVADGKTSLNDKLADLLARDRPDLAPALRDKRAIELRHLLSMSGGLFYTLTGPNDPLADASRDRLAVALTATAKAAPGTVFNYTVVGPILAGAALTAAAGEPEQQFAEERLFKPLQMRNHVWTGADGTGAVSGGSGLRLRAMDMAKLGVMMLHGGQWQNRQVVPRAWITQMYTPQPTAKDYGYFCWINHAVETEPEFGGMGFRGQFITILPERNAVVVMTSALPETGGVRDAAFLQLYRQMVTQFVLPALQGGTVAR